MLGNEEYVDLWISDLPSTFADGSARQDRLFVPQPRLNLLLFPPGGNGFSSRCAHVCIAASTAEENTQILLFLR